jgi:hypothetical protein
MAVRLQNKSKYLAIITVNSGKTYHVAPGKSSPPIEDLELSRNKKISKLVNSGQLAVTPMDHK